MREETMSVDIGAAAAVKINDGQAGFYRVGYENNADLRALGRRVKDKRLSPEDRWGLQNDLFARVQAGEVAIQEYLAFLDWYADEDAFLPLVSMDGHLRYAHLIAGPTTQLPQPPLADNWRNACSHRSAGHRPRRKRT